MKALTIDALWAWAIIWGPKRVENRGWSTSHRGPLVIHAGRNKSRDDEALEFLRSQGLDPPTGACLEEFRGCIIGVADLVDVVEFSKAEGGGRKGELGSLFPEPLSAFRSPPSALLTDPFAFGPQCWLLENPRALDVPIPAVGRQQLWNLDSAIDLC